MAIMKRLTLANISLAAIVTEETTPKTYYFGTATTAKVEPRLSQGTENVLRVKNTILATNRTEDMVIGYTVTLSNSAFIPEVLALVDGGTLTFDSTIANPSAAPTLATAATGGSLVAATYYVAYSWVNASGETLISTEASIATTGTVSTITVTIPALPVNVTSANIYIGTTAGAGTKQGSTATTSYTQTAVLVAGVAKPVASTIGNVISYDAGVKGSLLTRTPFTLKLYAEDKGGDSQTREVVEFVYKNCKGTPVSWSLNDGEFFVPEFVAASNPATGVSAVQLNFLTNAQYATIKTTAGPAAAL